MSKVVKQLVTDEIRSRLQGVQDAVVVNVIGLNTASTYQLRKRLREKNISLLVVKSSLAARAVSETPLSGAFEGVAGSSALCWGASDFVQLTKDVLEIQKEPQFEKFSTLGGMMDKEKLSSSRVEEVSKWPSRTEQLSILMGQILAPGAGLVSQLTAAGGALASQIKQKSEGDEAEA